MITLERKNGKLYLQLYEKLKNDIVNGVLPEGAALPAIRAFAKELNVSLNTVNNAYQKLQAEGFVYSRQGSGFYVEGIDNASESKDSVRRPEKIYDFSSHALPTILFPWSKWHTYINQALYTVEKATDESALIREADLSLRQSIARYVRHFRVLDVDPDQIIICAGEYDAAERIRNLLTGFMSGITFIEPVFPAYREIFRFVATRLRGLSINRIHTVEDLVEGRSNVFFASTEQMVQLYNNPDIDMDVFHKWLEAGKGYVIQCDRGQSAMPNFTPDQMERTIFLGSFDNLLPKELNFSYLILPRHLTLRAKKVFKYHRQVFPLSYQLALTAFMNDGQIFNLVRRSVFQIKKRRDTLADLCHRYLGNRAHCMKTNAYMLDGMLVIIFGIKNQKKLLDKLKAKGVIIKGCRKFWSKDRIGEQTFMFSYAAMSMEEMEQAFAIIKETVEGGRR